MLGHEVSEYARLRTELDATRLFGESLVTSAA
jgi:hypothetical protein